MSKSKVHVSPTHLLWFGGLTNSNRTGERFEIQSVAQIVISTATDKSQTLAFNYASLAINSSFFLAPSRTSRIPPTPSITIHTQTSPDTPNTPRAEPRNCADRQDSQPRAHTDFRCHHRSATRLSRRSEGLRRRRGAGGFVWFVTDALGRLGIVATYGAGHAPRRRAQSVSRT